jgi:hypothetical protein
MIPKIIWQTEENDFEGLLPFQKNITGTWKNLNPGWEYRYANSQQREQYVKDYSQVLHSIYKISSGGSQSDIWRALVLYENGGVYADMDSVCTMPLDDMIKKYYNGEDMICSSVGFQTVPFSVNTSNFASIKNSKTLELTIKKSILESEQILQNNSVLPATGFGAPVWKSFSDSIMENQKIICFQDSYFCHSDFFKNDFQLNSTVLYNDETLTYLDICKNNNYYIY